MQTCASTTKDIAIIEESRLLESASASGSESITGTALAEILFTTKETLLDRVSPRLRNSSAAGSATMATMDWFKAGDGNTLKSWGEVERDKARLRRERLIQEAFDRKKNKKDGFVEPGINW